MNLRDGAAFIFDIAAGTEVARLPLRFAEGDVAVNPETNMAVIVNRSLNILYVIDLATNILRGEYPLPSGINPLSVGVDMKSNVAVIAENGFSGAQHNGSDSGKIAGKRISEKGKAGVESQSPLLLFTHIKEKEFSVLNSDFDSGGRAWRHIRLNLPLSVKIFVAILQTP